MQINFALNGYGRAHGSRERWEKSLLCINRLHLPVNGSAIYKASSGELELISGHLYFLPNGFARNFELGEGEIYDHLYIDFQTFPPILGTEPVDIDISKDEFARCICGAFSALINTYETESAAQKKQIGEMLSMILRHLRIKYAVATVENKKIARAIRYIEEHYAEPIGNDDIARELGVDNRHLIRIFSKYMHISPHQYLVQCRIEHSIGELRRGRTVAETALLCGYQSENAFSISFKKTMGCTPGNFIK